jgi:hypothetical protein
MDLPSTGVVAELVGISSGELQSSEDKSNVWTIEIDLIAMEAALWR